MSSKFGVVHLSMFSFGLATLKVLNSYVRLVVTVLDSSGLKGAGQSLHVHFKAALTPQDLPLQPASHLSGIFPQYSGPQGWRGRGSQIPFSARLPWHQPCSAYFLSWTAGTLWHFLPAHLNPLKVLVPSALVLLSTRTWFCNCHPWAPLTSPSFAIPALIPKVAAQLLIWPLNLARNAAA